MNTWLFATIWVSMTLFVAGEVGKRHAPADRTSHWAWYAWAAGVGLCAVHMAIAMAVRYGWSHETAVTETAARAAAVYGFAWQGSLYVNYLFLGAWLGETTWWAVSPRTYLAREPASVWALRAFYVVIIVNAAVIFARASARPAGVVLVAVLMASWVRRR